MRFQYIFRPLLTPRKLCVRGLCEEGNLSELTQVSNTLYATLRHSVDLYRCLTTLNALCVSTRDGHQYQQSSGMLVKFESSVVIRCSLHLPLLLWVCLTVSLHQFVCQIPKWLSLYKFVIVYFGLICPWFQFSHYILANRVIPLPSVSHLRFERD